MTRCVVCSAATGLREEGTLRSALKIIKQLILTIPEAGRGNQPLTKHRVTSNAWRKPYVNERGLPKWIIRYQARLPMVPLTCVLCSLDAAALVPYYKMFLPVLNLNLEKFSNIGDRVS